MSANRAPTSQITSTSMGSPRSPARNPLVAKMPVPTMFDTTSAVALMMPSCRRRAAGLSTATGGEFAFRCATLDIVRQHSYDAGMRRLVPLVFAVGLLSCAQDEYQAQRERMVREQMESRDIRNREVLRAMRAVPRHLFVPPNLR